MQRHRRELGERARQRYGLPVRQRCDVRRAKGKVWVVAEDSRRQVGNYQLGKEPAVRGADEADTGRLNRGAVAGAKWYRLRVDRENLG